MAANGEVSDRVARDKERGITRISFTIDAKLRKNLRLAAAVTNQEVGEFAVKVLKAAAEKQVGRLKVR
jgi:uncharacterized protein (DUF1778 family)